MNRWYFTIFFFCTAINAWIMPFKCALYMWTDTSGGTRTGPLHEGSWLYSGSSWPNDAIQKFILYAQGYTCCVAVYGNGCGGNLLRNRCAEPSGSVSYSGSELYNGDTCFVVTATATPNPTKRPTQPSNHPTEIPTIATTLPTFAPTSSCVDYKNETSDDGHDEMRPFNAQHVTTIDNYNCTGSDCVIQCNQSASCLETDIQINIQSKTSLLLCHDAYSCASASIKTQSGSMANISVVCIGQYSCINMDIQLANISSFNLYCLRYKSCLDVSISIDSNNNDTRHNDGIISCVSLHSCDHLVIATNSNQTQLVMYQHSEDVTLSNGAGYFYDYDNIICSNDRFVRYETDMVPTEDNITSLIFDEYHSQIWPCLDVHV
eukprot:314881_1